MAGESKVAGESKHTGGCGCGAVRWELSEAPAGASYCHCTRCQRRTGTGASAGAKVVPGTFTITEGEEHIRAWKPGGGWEKHFCGLCGSALFSLNPEDPESIGLRMGGFDADPGVRPSFRQFVDDAAVWERIPADGLPRYAERPPDPGERLL